MKNVFKGLALMSVAAATLFAQAAAPAAAPAAGPSPDEMADRLFQYDRDGDGRLSRDELIAALRDLPRPGGPADPCLACAPHRGGFATGRRVDRSACARVARRSPGVFPPRRVTRTGAT